MKLIDTRDAVGHVLCHDITQIIPGVTKDAVFRKGHVVREEDIPVLLSVGKEHLYVWEQQEGMLHENEGAEILRSLCQGENLNPTPVKEGKIELVADCDGVLLVDRAKLRAVNSLGELMIASRHGNFPVSKGDKVAGTRVIPLVIAQEKLDRAREVTGGGPIFRVLPFHPKRVGLVVTGSEVYYGRIEDKFTPVLEAKMAEYGAEIIGREVTNDEAEMTTEAIFRLLEAGAEMVLCTGGMSVDPDDRTPLAIRNTGAEIVTYGAPVLPGAMFLLAYWGERRIPIVGLPGCVMYAKRTIFDLVLPRLMADVPVRRADLDGLGEGGLCLNCPTCTFPNCGFGKGS
ncbi:MAG TPA: molybdopterin-binding protein [Candidatus Onthomonas avicola]|nr:molybdopterin-binding protein [Candidatus Onthomonas avicola]